MKRFSCALLAALLLTVSLTGCAGRTASSAPEPDMIITEGSVLSRPETESLPQGSGETPPAQASLPELSQESEPPQDSLKESSSASQSSASSQTVSSVSSTASSEKSSASSAQVSSMSASSAQSSSSQATPPSGEGSFAGQEYRAVWYSYLDLSGMLQGQSQSAFRSSIRTAFSRSAGMGCNTAIVQVRPFADALYPSQYFPWSYICTGTEGVDPGFDPLQVMIEEAHSLGMKIEAWINPYRIRTSGSKYGLSADNPASLWEESGNDYVIRDGGIYYNPGRAEVRKLIINGVKEIVENYEVDGIHFDDYFYPDPDESFDAQAYADYKAGGGTLSLGSWRRENVNILVRDTYSAVKAIDPSVRFGVSPQANNDINYEQQYIDVDTWLSVPGYVDYICPQIYYGFDNATCPYEETVALWNHKIKVSGIDLYVGLAPYKIGLVDSWAGTGKNEWVNDQQILARQVLSAREYSNYGGFALFRYASLFAPDSSVKNRVEKERNALADLL